MSALQRVARKLSEVGPVYAAVLALRRVVPARVLRASRCSLYRLDTDAARPLEPLPARWAGPVDAALLGGFGHPPEVIEARLARGSLVCVLESAGRLDAYVWFQAGEFLDTELRTRFRLRPGDIWLYDAMVAPALRGQGIYPRLLATAAGLLRECGHARIWIEIDDLNRNSIAAHCAAGAVAAGGASILEIGGFARIADASGRADWLRPGASRVKEPG
jgi:GNAT superfamily N-acetyltransferase